jgi:zinc finger protein
MTDTSHQTLDGVAGLMAERRRYEDWIAALDARRATTPQHVYERVRLDYETRLQAVLTRLSTHRDALQQSVKELTDRIALLKTEEKQRHDERSELELRAHVGELSEAEFQAAKNSLDETIRRLSTEQSSLSTDLVRTREFLQAATPPGAHAAAPVAAPSSTPRAAAAGQPAPRQPAPPPTAAAPPASAPPARAAEPAQPDAAAPTNFDELAFLHSVVGPGAQGRRPQQPDEIAPPEPSAVSDVKIMRDEAASLGESLLARVNQPQQGGGDIIRQEPTDALAGAQGKRNSTNDTPLAANVTGNNPIVLKGGETVSGKTLKCSECGAMNYPTEWYCERCGAELASL